MASEALSLDSFTTQKTTSGKMQDKALMDLFDLISLGLSFSQNNLFLLYIHCYIIGNLLFQWFYLPGTEVNKNHLEDKWQVRDIFKVCFSWQESPYLKVMKDCQKGFNHWTCSSIGTFCQYHVNGKYWPSSPPQELGQLGLINWR